MMQTVQTTQYLNSTERLDTVSPSLSVSVIIPVYQGEKTLQALIAEMNHYVIPQKTSGGFRFTITEIVLVWDGAIDNSAQVIKTLATHHTFIRPVWLSRNFGQHAATLAGIAGCSGDWIVTLDEDGLHNPADIPRLLETALSENQPLVYGIGANPAPHGLFRNTASKIAHWTFSRFLGDANFDQFSSFRLIRGDLGRSLAAFCGNGVYLDAALNWVAPKSASIPVRLREEGRAATNYKFSRLLEHFSRMVFSSKKTPLRLVMLMGLFTMLLSATLTAYALYLKFTGNVPIQGWTSLFILISFCFGVMMLTMGILAEYIGLILSLSMGKPLFLIQSNAPETSKA